MEHNKDYLFLGLIVILGLYLYKLQQDKEQQDDNHNQKMQMMTAFVKIYKKHIDEHKRATLKIAEKPSTVNPVTQEPVAQETGNIIYNTPKPNLDHGCQDNVKLTTDDMIKLRDRAVVRSALYPPLGRMPKPLANNYLNHKLSGVFDQPTQYNGDTYKLMAYLVNTVNKDEKWNVYGRQKYSGSSQGDFYAIQQCLKDPCVKIELTNDMMEGDKLNDYYNLPSELKIKSPLFSTDPYTVVQLKTSVGYSPYF